jgi:hypothetical protein
MSYGFTGLIGGLLVAFEDSGYSLLGFGVVQTCTASDQIRQVILIVVRKLALSQGVREYYASFGSQCRIFLI